MEREAKEAFDGGNKGFRLFCSRESNLDLIWNRRGFLIDVATSNLVRLVNLIAADKIPYFRILKDLLWGPLIGSALFLIFLKANAIMIRSSSGFGLLDSIFYFIF